MRELIKQCTALWGDLKPIQKLTAALVVLFVGGALTTLILRSSSSAFVPLYPSTYSQVIDLSEVRHYLKQFSVPYKENSDKELLVPEEHVERIRMELLSVGIPKHDQGKGFELFDSNTWIKGEKELQVLEMRALKGQLEKDLAGFDQIKSASVILDLAPSRSLGSSPYKTKASVILTLMPNAHLSTSQLRAITYHLTGAVRGLEPNRIAISDTTGHLYQAIHEGTLENSTDAQLIFEGHLKGKIDQVLAKMVGEEHFFSTVQAQIDRESKQAAALSVHALIDQEAVVDPTERLVFEKEITKQLTALTSGYGVPVEAVVDFFPFKRKNTPYIEKEKRENTTILFVTTAILVVGLAVAGYFFLFQSRQKKSKSEPKDPLLHLMTTVDLQRLARSIEGEDPETIAEMISYLEPSRAEKLIAAFPRELQERILFHLTEMEKAGI